MATPFRLPRFGVNAFPTALLGIAESGIECAVEPADKDWGEEKAMPFA